MRRAHSAYPPPGSYQPQGTDSILEADNDRLTDELKGKISSLKSLSIDIGGEVRGQNNFLSEMDDTMDGAGGFLGKAMSRVKRLGQGSQNYVTLYLVLFALFVFFIIWVIVKF